MVKLPRLRSGIRLIRKYRRENHRKQYEYRRKVDFYVPLFYYLNINVLFLLLTKELLMNLAFQPEERYSYKDYYEWDNDLRWELIDGTPYNMTPAPSRAHQHIVGDTYRQIANFLDDKSCEIYIAPFDVRLPLGESETADDNIFNVVQPDISVICDIAKLDNKGCVGAPDIIIEVLSPATATKDLREKRELYEKAGVKEYWIFHPIDQTVMVYRLNENKRYEKADIFDNEDVIVTKILEEFELNLEKIFSN